MDIKEFVGYKIETEIERKRGSTTVESYVIFSKMKNKDKTWVEIHMGIKGAALKDFVIAFEDSVDRTNPEALRSMAIALTEEYADGVASELLDLIPEPEEG